MHIPMAIAKVIAIALPSFFLAVFVVAAGCGIALMMESNTTKRWFVLHACFICCLLFFAAVIEHSWLLNTSIA